MALPRVAVPLRFLREAVSKGFAQVRLQLEFTLPKRSTLTSTASKLQLACTHAPTHFTHSLHSRIKVSHRWYGAANRWYSTANRFISHNAAINPSNPTSTHAPWRVVQAMSKMTKTTPFATTLRPRLSSGAFPRRASGYSLGNGGATGARYFSSGPAIPAEAITQVAQAIRAMAMSGKNVAEEYRKYKNGGRASVTVHLAAMCTQNGTAPGAYVDFPMAASFTFLRNAGSTAARGEDFTEIVNDAIVWSELQKLARFGTLPISLAEDKEDTIRIRFPGRDLDMVSRLCDEVGVTRGVIGEERRFAFELLVPALDMNGFTETGTDFTPPGSVEGEEEGEIEGSYVSEDGFTETGANFTPPGSVEGETEGEIEGSYVSEDGFTETGTNFTPPESVEGETEGEIEGSRVSEDGFTETGTDLTPPGSVEGEKEGEIEGSGVSGLSPLSSPSDGSMGAALMTPPFDPPPQQVPVHPEPEVGFDEELQRFLERCQEGLWEGGEADLEVE